MKISITHNGLDWLVHVIDYDYAAEVIQTHDEQGFPESAHITDGFVQLDSVGVLCEQVNAQLCERADGLLFNMLIELYQDDINDKLLGVIHERAETQERDWAGEAEEADCQRREDFKTRRNRWL